MVRSVLKSRLSVPLFLLVSCLAKAEEDPVLNLIDSDPSLRSQIKYYASFLHEDKVKEGEPKSGCIKLSPESSESPEIAVRLIAPSLQSVDSSLFPASMCLEETEYASSLAVSEFNKIAGELLTPDHPFYMDRFLGDAMKNLHFEKGSEVRYASRTNKLLKMRGSDIVRGATKTLGDFVLDGILNLKAATSLDSESETQPLLSDQNGLRSDHLKLDDQEIDKSRAVKYPIKKLLPKLELKEKRTKILAGLGVSVASSGVLIAILGALGLLSAPAGMATFTVASILSGAAILANAAAHKWNTQETCDRFSILRKHNPEFVAGMKKAKDKSVSRWLEDNRVDLGLTATDFTVGGTSLLPGVNASLNLGLCGVSGAINAYSCVANATSLYNVSKYGTEFNSTMSDDQMLNVIKLEQDLKQMYEGILEDKQAQIRKFVRRGARIAAHSSTSKRERDEILKNISKICEASIARYTKMQEEGVLAFEKVIKKLEDAMKNVEKSRCIQSA